MTMSFPSLPQSSPKRDFFVLFLALLTALAASASATEPQKPEAPASASAPAVKKAAGTANSEGELTAEKKFKNIKVLRSMPASQMLPVMHLMRTSLGVSCDFCHVTEGEQFELDTKKE